MSIVRILFTAALPAFFAQAVAAAALPVAPFMDGGVTVIPVDTTKQKLTLYLKDGSGRPYRSFARLASSLARAGRQLRFAMNAGMYEENGEPVGLLVIDGHTLHPLNRQDGKGNFYLKPNGVFAITDSGPRVVTAAAYDTIGAGVRFATQSGPMLVLGGRINPALDPSWAKFTRNGVCVIGKTVYFAISDKPVSLYDFAAWFRDRLGCRDALYLDGSVSSLYSTTLRRDDQRDGLGPLVGIAE